MGIYGKGARGIVYASFDDGGKTAYHYFNVVNQGGTVRFLDGRAGGGADLGKYTIEKFLRTN